MFGGSYFGKSYYGGTYWGPNVSISVIAVPRSKGGRTRKIIDDRLPRLLREDREILELVMIITITGTLDE